MAVDALLLAKIVAIQRKLKRLRPDGDIAAEHAWTGSFGTSDTGTPTTGRVPRMRICGAVPGYGGNGITFSRLAAQMLRSMTVDTGDLDAPLFAFA